MLQSVLPDYILIGYDIINYFRSQVIAKQTVENAAFNFIENALREDPNSLLSYWGQSASQNHWI